jgi:predicted ArsR family transcriptional regulator
VATEQDDTTEGGPDLDARLAAVGALADRVRRRLYRFVVRRGEPVGREEAAREVGVAHHVAKFHLDRLEEAGLLATEYRRPPGRGGPGAGRPAKLYRRSDMQVDVSVPERRYEFVARLLAGAVDRAATNRSSVADELHDGAVAAGQEIGNQARRDLGRRPRRDQLANIVSSVLAQTGYEPAADGRTTTLGNCPFRAVSDEHTELICGMNLAFVEGVLRGVDASWLRAELVPDPGRRCCVRIVPTR